MNNLLKLSLLLLALLLPATATAYQRYQFESNGVFYRISGNQAVVTCKYDNCDFDDEDYIISYSSDYSGFVVIPETVNYNGNTYSVTEIDSYAFWRCSTLTSVVIPSSIRTIGSCAFEGCTGLTSINMPNSVTTIGRKAFYRCSNLNSITVPSSVTSVGKYAFDLTAWFNQQPVGVVYIGFVAYCYKGTMPSGTTISLKYGTLCIAEFAFGHDDEDEEYECSALIGVDIPNTVKAIGPYAFSYCTGLTSINIPDSVIAIGYGAFASCTSLTSVTIGNSATSIGSSAFSYCSSLSEVTIPNSVNFIGGHAFYDCTGLYRVNSLIVDPSRVSLEYNAFARSDSYYNSRKLYVPYGSKSAYEAISLWRNYFGSIVEMEPDTILATSIEIDVTETVMNEGETVQLSATVIPEETTNRAVTWASSDEAVATVDENGLVTAVAPGSAIITATTIDGSNLSASCNVTVLQGIVQAESIKLNVTTAGLNEGATLQLTATVLPEGASCESVIWASNNPSVATVDSNGLVTTHSVGTATITAITTDGSNLSTTCTVTLLPVGVKGDVNGDNNINISDVTKLIDYLLSGSW